jgi:threonine dehydrogenase-like Zn-dependent dehydrogenase
MRAAVLRDGRLEVRETDDPTPGPGQILVRTLACGICASDVHFMDHPDADASDDSGLSKYDANADIVMGHEYCAEIVEYGADTQQEWPVGSRVSSLPVLLTSSGPRVIGQSNEAPGGFGEYFLMSESVTQKVQTELPAELVAVSDAISVGWSFVKRAQVSAKDIPLVLGCGAIGLAVIASLKRLGIGPIVAVDFQAARRETALMMGADMAVDPAEFSPYESWRRVAYGSPEALKDIMNLLDTPGCVAFECVGIPGVLDSIIKGCERGTRIFSAGGAPQGDHLSTMVAKRKGLNIQFGGGPSITHWNEAFEEVCSGRLDVSPMTGQIIGLDGVAGGIDDSRHGRGPARIIVVP